MKIVKFNEKQREEIINESINILKSDGLVVFPSDTVYGLLADTSNEKAIKKLIKFKNRPAGKPISVFVDSFLMLKKYVYLNKKQETILKNILPGCFTVILPSKHKTSFLLESEKGTLGIRLVKYQLIIDLVKKFGKAITATSANLGGKSPHYSIESFLKQIPKGKLELIDLVIDAGKLPRNKPSTVINLTEEEIKILREGDVKFTQTKIFTSTTEEETKKIAKKVIKFLLNYKNYKKIKKSLTLLLKGELGVGKTIFTKGIGEYFNIKNIISPSFVIYYQYPLKSNFFKNFYHFDFFNIKEKDELNYLGLEKILKEKNLIIIEWGEKAGEIIELLKKKSNIVWLEFSYLNNNQRKIVVKV